MHAAKTALGPVSVPQVLCALGAGLWLSEYVQLGFVYTYSISGASGDLRWLSIPLALPLALAVIFVLGRRHAPLSDRGGRAAAVLTMVVIACFVVNYPYSRDVYYASQYAEGMLLSWSLTFAMVFFGTFVAGESAAPGHALHGRVRAWRRAGGAVRLACARPVLLLYFPGPAHFALQTGGVFFGRPALLRGEGAAGRQGGPARSFGASRGPAARSRARGELRDLRAEQAEARGVLALGAWIPAEADSRGSCRTPPRAATSTTSTARWACIPSTSSRPWSRRPKARSTRMARVCPGDGLPVAGGIALEAYRPPAWQGAKPVFARCRGGRRTPSLVLRLTAGRGFVLLGELDRHDVAHGRRNSLCVAAAPFR